MTINVDTSARAEEEALSLPCRICPVCLRLTCSIKNRPKFVPIIGCAGSPPCLLLPLPCSCSLLDYKFLGVCVPCAECQQQLRLNSNWHLMISCYLSLPCSACYAQPLPGWSSSSSWHTTRSHVANLRRRRRTSGSVIRSSRRSSHKSQCFGLTASPAGTLTLWPAWLRSGAAHALPARRCLQAVG